MSQLNPLKDLAHLWIKIHFYQFRMLYTYSTPASTCVCSVYTKLAVEDWKKTSGFFPPNLTSLVILL